MLLPECLCCLMQKQRISATHACTRGAASGGLTQINVNTTKAGFCPLFIKKKFVLWWGGMGQTRPDPQYPFLEPWKAGASFLKMCF